MKKFLLGLAVLSTLTVVSCKPKPTDPVVVEPENTELKGEITEDRTLKTGNTYTMDGVVYVKNGATLTIEPGVTVKAVKGKTCLVVTRGAKIMAVGSATSPIVFTSAEGAPGYGDWGGLVILGNATTNATFNSQPGQGEIEGGVNNSNNDGVYGGSNDDDNSGKLKYVRIEYAGYPFQPDKELNSLTLGGVGRGTEIDYVQCAFGYDDAFEMFGGTVNLKHIIAYKGLDDEFDTDFGYRGNVQFAIAVRNKDQADISGSNGFECDNDASGSTTAPFTAPVFSNVTLIGPKENSSTTINSNFKRAAHLRRNSRTSIFNSVMIGYPTGILIDGSKTATELLSEVNMEIKGVIIAGMSKPLDTAGTTSTNLAWTTLFNTAGWGNAVLTNTSDVNLSAAYGAGASFNPAPTGASPAASGAVFSSSKLNNGFFTNVSYRGAAGVGDNWWTGWAKFD